MDELSSADQKILKDPWYLIKSMEMKNPIYPDKKSQQYEPSCKNNHNYE